MKRSAVSVSIPLTAGELIQGTYRGRLCLISCPINRVHSASVTLTESDGWVLPHQAEKTISAIDKARERLPESPPGGILELSSPAPRERGYGTSTADISASLYAFSAACGQPFQPETVAKIAVAVEPSDSSLFPGLTLFDHREGRRIQPLGEAPPFSILLLDPGGRVNTLSFNQQEFARVLKPLADQHQEIFDNFITGLETMNWELMGEAASRSAILHQQVLFSSILEPAQKLAEETRALGICRAHSGTLVGLLYPPFETNLDEKKAYIEGQLSDSVDCQLYRCVNGGPQYHLSKTLKEKQWN